MSLAVVNLAKPKAEAKHEDLFNKLDSISALFLLALPESTRLAWKKIARRPSLFCLMDKDKERSVFITLASGAILETGSLIAKLTLDDPNQCKTFAVYSGNPKVLGC
jgi:hypothetical protein